MRLWLAFRAFFAVLSRPAVAEETKRLLSAPKGLPAPAAESKAEKEKSPAAKAPPPKPAPPKPTRSDALALLAALQREARLLDLVQEPLAGYSDQQIGAAARDVLRDAAKVLERMFALAPLEAAEEGATVEVPAGYDPQRFRVTGAVAGQPPFRGTVVHPGWKATKCELPAWTGSEESKLVVAPCEVEVK